MKKKFGFGFALLSVVALLGLTACGGGGGDGGVAGDGSGGPNNDIGETGAAHTIVLTWPITDAIENVGGGVYRRLASAIVTDESGHPVPDGTVVKLDVTDSILATGVITTAGGDDITGSVLTDMAPTEADGATPVNFDGAVVTRNHAQRFIQSGDSVLLINADGEDKVRGVTGLSNNTVTTSSSYDNLYPNAVYDSSSAEKTTSYVVAASLLGAVVSGVDSDGNQTSGRSSTVDGIATFNITYPANSTTINTGCGGVPAIDARAAPTGSADVFISASVDNKVTTVNYDFCFPSIAGGTVEVTPSTASGTVTVTLLLRDGGDTVPIPYAGISASVVATGAIVATPDLGTYTTNQYGYASSTVTIAGGASGDTATITYEGNGGAIGTLTITLP